MILDVLGTDEIIKKTAEDRTLRRVHISRKRDTHENRKGVFTDAGRNPEESSCLKCRSECVFSVGQNRCGWGLRKSRWTQL